MDPISEVTGRLKRDLKKNNLIIFVGTGCSASTIESLTRHPYTTWSGLIQEGINFCKSRGLIDSSTVRNLKSDISNGFLVAAASKLVGILGGEESDNYRDWLGNTIGQLSPANPKLIQTIAKLKAPILTTNYDSLIEQITNYTSYHQHTSTKDLQLCVRGDQEGIIHVHGIWSEPKTVVLDFQSYYKVIENQPIQQVLQGVLVTKTVLFIGFGSGLEDLNFKQLISSYKTNFPLPHYQLVLNKDMPAYKPVTGVTPVAYGDKYEDIHAFLNLLITYTNEERKENFIEGLKIWREALDRVFLNSRWPKSTVQQQDFYQMSSDLYMITSEIQKAVHVTKPQKKMIKDLTDKMTQLITDILYSSVNSKLATRMEFAEWVTIHEYAQLSVIQRLQNLP